MRLVNTAKTHLSRLLEEVAAGEEIKHALGKLCVETQLVAQAIAEGFTSITSDSRLRSYQVAGLEAQAGDRSARRLD